MRGMYSAVSGLKQHQTMLDVTSNNLANVNTIAFKGARTTFKDQLQQMVFGASASGAQTAGSNAAQVGLGVQLGTIDSMMGGGSLQVTGAPLDVAVQGEGWFRVGSGVPPAMPGGIQYTRAGNFQRNDQGYLTTANGQYVMGQTNGQDAYIQIPAGAGNVAVAANGDVSYVPAGGGARVTAGTLSLAKFANENGLTRSAGGVWDASSASGAEVVGTPGGSYGGTAGGTLESSNVDLATEFTTMITAQRGFQANSRVISVSDEMMQDLVNLKR